MLITFRESKKHSYVFEWIEWKGPCAPFILVSNYMLRVIREEVAGNSYNVIAQKQLMLNLQINDLYRAHKPS